MRLKRRALIIGTGPEAHMIMEAIKARPHCGFEVAGFIDGNPHKPNAEAGVRILGSLSKLDNIVKEHQIHVVVMAQAPELSQGLLTSLSHLSFSSPTIIDMPCFYEFLCGKIPIQYISESWLYMHSVIQRKTYYRHLKRIIDLVVAGLSLILFLPLGVLIAVAIRLDSPGPIFFLQQRLGKNNKPFTILKFRTMFYNGGEVDPKWTVARDPRVTCVGRFLRKLHLDELPQLINIWKGDMSLIGPRAEWDLFANNALEKTIKWRPGLRATDKPGLMVECGFEERIPFYSFRTVVRPGITGWAQVNSTMAGSSLEELTEKLQYDLYYVKNMGFWLDISILLKTIRIVFLGGGK
jgi:lipopolysaccharide/colanic/teichoic acid biosynthesis glycosyltransferase